MAAGASSVLNDTAALDIVWGQSAAANALYPIAAALDIGWGMSADALYVPRPVNPPNIFTFNDVSASVHTVDGRTVGHFPCDALGQFQWGR